jgi:hypothetical protein
MSSEKRVFLLLFRKDTDRASQEMDRRRGLRLAIQAVDRVAVVVRATPVPIGGNRYGPG